MKNRDIYLNVPEVYQRTIMYLKKQANKVFVSKSTDFA